MAMEHHGSHSYESQKERLEMSTMGDPKPETCAAPKPNSDPIERCNYPLHGPNVAHSWQAVERDHLHRDKVKVHPQPEMVDHPAHYGGKDNLYEHVKVMEAVLSESPMNPYLGGLFYNVTKYLWRLGKKYQPGQEDNPMLEDAKKAKWYLDRLVQYLEGEK